jgi:hypothetical protein
MANTDAYTAKASDHFRMEASKLMLSPADGTYNLIRIPMFALVIDVWIQIVTAFTGDASVTVGWLGNGETADEEGFIVNDIADPINVGLKRGFNIAENTFPGKYFSEASGVVTATVAANYTGAVKDFRVFAHFTVIHP